MIKVTRQSFAAVISWVAPFFGAKNLSLGIASVAFVLGGGTTSEAAIPEELHPLFERTEINLPGGKYLVMGMDFLPDGRMAMAVTDFKGGGEVPSPRPASKVLLISNLDVMPEVKTIADMFRQPTGITVVEGKVYVADRDGHYLIPNLQGSGSENKQKVASFPGPYWHQWVFTPVYRNGFFWAPYSGTIRGGGLSNADPTSDLSGAFLKWDLQGKMEAYAGGLRSPNGSNISAAGLMAVADNQGSFLPGSAFMIMVPGKFFGHKQGDGFKRNIWESKPYEPTAVWLPHGAVRESPGQPLALESGFYKGDWLLGDCMSRGLVRIQVDEVKPGKFQGSVFWFSHGFGTAALNRLVSDKQGRIYVGTFGVGGNWPDEKKPQPFWRLTEKPGSLFDFRAIRSVVGGLELEFTESVDKAAMAVGKFTVRQWKMNRGSGYGCCAASAQSLTISSVDVSDDGKRVFLKVDNLSLGDQVTHVRLNGLNSAKGQKVWSDEGWLTLNEQSDKAFSRATVSISLARQEGLKRAVHKALVMPYGSHWKTQTMLQRLVSGRIIP